MPLNPPVLSLLWLAWLQIASALRRGDSIPLYYGKIYSARTQLAYPFSSLSFICPPYTENAWLDLPRRSSWLVLDQDLRGDRPINVLEDSTCNTLCSQAWSVYDAMAAKELILEDYQVEWWLDGLLGATPWYTNTNVDPSYHIGFPLGRLDTEKTYIHNHVLLKIRYTTTNNPDEISIVGFEVYPDSLQGEQCRRMSLNNEMQEVTGRRTTVTFSYSVLWSEVKRQAPLRWDMYLALPDLDAYRVALLVNIIIVLLLQGVIAVILKKTLYKNTHRKDDSDFKLLDDADNAIGWRLIQSDVFRRPYYGGLLAPVIGSGVQVLVIALAWLGSISLGWGHPAKPGSMLRWAMLAALPGGALGGYWSGRIYRDFSGRSWLLNALLTVALVPGSVIASVLAKSFIAWSYRSSLALSLGGWLRFLAWCAFLLGPLIVGGAYLGDQHDQPDHATRTKQLPRLIPRKRWYQKNSMSIALGGVIQFGIIFVNLEDLFRFLWQGELYMVIRLSITVCVLSGIAAAEVAFVLVFFQLCSEDHRWWWTSFMIGASPSLYTFLYGMTYYIIRTDIHGLFGLAAWTLNLMLCCSFIGLCTGTIGFFSAYFMIQKIYTVSKVD